MSQMTRKELLEEKLRILNELLGENNQPESCTTDIDTEIDKGSVIIGKGTKIEHKTVPLPPKEKRKKYPREHVWDAEIAHWIDAAEDDVALCADHIAITFKQLGIIGTGGVDEREWLSRYAWEHFQERVQDGTMKKCGRKGFYKKIPQVQEQNDNSAPPAKKESTKRKKGYTRCMDAKARAMEAIDQMSSGKEFCYSAVVRRMQRADRSIKDTVMNSVIRVVQDLVKKKKVVFVRRDGYFNIFKKL